MLSFNMIDFKWTKVLFQEFFGHTGGSEVFCFDKDWISDFQIQSGFLFGVRRSLISFLCMGHFFSEELMEFIKVYSIFSCVGGGKITFWMNGQVQMISLIGKEG
jgi:hypothetical protein